MNEIEAFSSFVSKALENEKSRRYLSLAGTKKGKKKILDDLCHGFESAILNKNIVDSDSGYSSKACYLYSGPTGFGIRYDTVLSAYEDVSMDDSWLIISDDGRYGIHRPESRWDDEKKILV